MIEIDEAIEKVLAQTRPLATETVLLADGIGRVLAESVSSDIDSPPHDKALMDGFAIRCEDLQKASEPFEVVETIAAGDVPSVTLRAGQSARIMTGAPIPAGADAVIMVEEAIAWESPTPQDRATVAKASHVCFPDVTASIGQNIMRRATSLARGETVLAAGQRLRAAEIGLLAEVGRAEIRVAVQPRVAILSTGNELVPPSVRPQPGQIRNSNGALLQALVSEADAEPVALGIAPDDPHELQSAMRNGLEHDVFVLSGGVSAGVFDLVPATLEDCGVEAIFHKVHLKPGKPIFFGVLRREEGLPTLVFGLPGNPVSTLVGFRLFVQAALQRMMGRCPLPSSELTARLAVPFSHRGGRPTFWPATLRIDQGTIEATPLDWKGSADQRTVASADGFLFFPKESRDYEPGDVVAWMSHTQSVG